MPNRTSRRPLAALLVPVALVVLASACSSKSSSAGTSSNPTVSSPGVTSKGSAPKAGGVIAAPTTFKMTTVSGHHYTVTLTPKSPTAEGPCTGDTTTGRIIMPFTVAIKNESAAAAPEPWIGFAFTDPQAQHEVAAVKVSGTCIDFTLKGNTIPASGTTTYDGSISNVDRSSAMIVNLNEIPAGAAATVPVPLFQ